MKSVIPVLAGLASLGALISSTESASAQLLEKVSISATAYEQGAASDNNTVTTTKAPAKVAISTATILKQLATDEFSEGRLNSANLPASAKLDFNGTGFEIDQGTNELVDVSDIMTWSAAGSVDITSGNFLDASGQGIPPFTQTDSFLAAVIYRNTNAAAALNFSVTGLATVTQKATTPNARTGSFVQSGSMTLADGTGEGTNASGPIILSGFTISATGSAAGNTGLGTNP
jgi:hypothetical protein